jgi:hypothetical protein
VFVGGVITVIEAVSAVVAAVNGGLAKLFPDERLSRWLRLLRHRPAGGVAGVVGALGAAGTLLLASD